MSSRLRATLIGGVAILLWSLLALFTAASGTVPPLQLTAMSFAIGATVGAVVMRRSGRSWRVLRQPWPVWMLGVTGLFGYHLAYFTALRHAPPVDAGLIAYLWPLLIVLLSALLPGERLRGRHLLGAALGFAGAALIVTGGRLVELRGEFLFGYSVALVCALIWSGYSVLSRRFAQVPTDVVTGFCAVTAVLAAAAHGLLETTVWPSAPGQWLAILGLGLGPVGAAFYVWDHGVKHGDIQLLGALSYLAPLLSTLVLIAAGMAVPTTALLIACVLITGGAVVASWDVIAQGLGARKSGR